MGASVFRSAAGGSTFLVTLTVMLGLIMAIIDSSIVNVALDTISGNLGASLDEASSVATGYILASVVTMPLNGYLTARRPQALLRGLHRDAAAVCVEHNGEEQEASVRCGIGHMLHGFPRVSVSSRLN